MTKWNINRRRFLQLVGAGAALVTVPTVLLGAEKYKELRTCDDLYNYINSKGVCASTPSNIQQFQYKYILRRQQQYTHKFYEIGTDITWDSEVRLVQQAAKDMDKVFSAVKNPVIFWRRIPTYVEEGVFNMRGKKAATVSMRLSIGQLPEKTDD